ncbi:MAG: hypothetical protein ACKVQK_04395 [Burkholderiales bacterium]
MRAARQSTIQEIEAFLNGDGGPDIVVAQVPADIKNRLQAETDDVLFSSYTAQKQRRHPEITAQSFSWLQEMLDTGERLYDKKHHATVIHHREKPYVAVLKATSSGDKVYLQSFRRTDEKNISSLRKKSAGDG